MKTFAVMSLFTLAPAVVFTPAARAQQVQPPPQVAVAEPYQMPDPYQPPDPYDTAADPSQIDWPQDTAAEEPAVDDYDDGYDPQAYTEFQDDLAPYGNWIDDGTYGRVWQPEGSLVGAEFTPYYSGGHWALTEFGWTWVSDWSWGWAPFHYGRWIVVSGYGWCWVPGTIWGPAWVAWRAGDGYVGWASAAAAGRERDGDLRDALAVAVLARGGSERAPTALRPGARRARDVPPHDAGHERSRSDPWGNDGSHQRRPPPRQQRGARPADGHRAAGLPAARDPSAARRDDVVAAVDPRGDRGRRSREQRRRRTAAGRGRAGRPQRGTGRRPDACVRSGAGADRAAVAVLVVRLAARLQPTAAGRARGAREQPTRVHEHRAAHLQPAFREWRHRTSTTRRRLAAARTSTTRRPRAPDRASTTIRRPRTPRHAPTASRRRTARRTRSAGRRRRSTIRRRARSRARLP